MVLCQTLYEMRGPRWNLTLTTVLLALGPNHRLVLLYPFLSFPLLVAFVDEAAAWMVVQDQPGIQ